MKLHLHFTRPFYLGYSNPKVMVFSNSISESEVSKNANSIFIKNEKLSIKKILPQHWFDGVWDNLDYKM